MIFKAGAVGTGASPHAIQAHGVLAYGCPRCTTALAPAFAQLAAEERERAQRAQEVAVRRIGVFVVIPLGLCFLPAFLLIGVVPIVAGLVSGLLI